MIKKEDLLAIAKFKNLAPRFAELDYLQDIALLHLSREFGNTLVFKGGTCLYKVYKLNRFSEDLDFTAGNGFRPKDFFHRLPYFFSLLNLKSKITVKKFQNTLNVYTEIVGPMYDGRKETLTTLIFNISQREKVFLPSRRFPYISIYQEIRPFDLFVMDETEILAEKIRAIYGRNKARDVYDLWYLLSRKGVLFDFELVQKKLSHDKIKFDKSRFLAKLEEKKSSWERDLAGLIAGDLPAFVPVLKEIMEKIGQQRA